jgi:hypothetical protein
MILRTAWGPAAPTDWRRIAVSISPPTRPPAIARRLLLTARTVLPLGSWVTSQDWNSAASPAAKPNSSRQLPWATDSAVLSRSSQITK